MEGGMRLLKRFVLVVCTCKNHVCMHLCIVHVRAMYMCNCIERLQLRHEMTSRLLPYGKNARSESAAVFQLLLQT